MPAKETYKKYLKKEGLTYSERVDITAFDRSHNNWDSIDMRINAATELKILEGIDTSNHIETLEALQVSNTSTQDFLEKEYYQIMKYEKASPIKVEPTEKSTEQEFNEEQLAYIQSKIELAESALQVASAEHDLILENQYKESFGDFLNQDEILESDNEPYEPQGIEHVEKRRVEKEKAYIVQEEKTNKIERTLSEVDAKEVNDLFIDNTHPMPSSYVPSVYEILDSLPIHINNAKEIFERNQPKGAEVTIERSANKVGVVSKAVTFERDR